MIESLVSRMTGRRKGEIIMLQGWEFAHSLIAHSLTLLICSHRSNQMSYCERFAQIARDKWATMSESLRLLMSLMSKERPWANSSGRSWQMSDREQIAQVAQDKWANEQISGFFWANCSFALLLRKNERFAHKNLT